MLNWDPVKFINFIFDVEFDIERLLERLLIHLLTILHESDGHSQRLRDVLGLDTEGSNEFTHLLDSVHVFKGDILAFELVVELHNTHRYVA